MTVWVFRWTNWKCRELKMVVTSLKMKSQYFGHLLLLSCIANMLNRSSNKNAWNTTLREYLSQFTLLSLNYRDARIVSDLRKNNLTGWTSWMGCLVIFISFSYLMRRAWTSQWIFWVVSPFLVVDGSMIPILRARHTDIVVLPNSWRTFTWNNFSDGKG